MFFYIPARSFLRPCRYLILSIHTYKVEKNLAGYSMNIVLMNNQTQVPRKELIGMLRTTT
jgi:hypothetical protein